MNAPLIGIVVSALCSLILIMLYRAEAKRGFRFFEYPRQQFDLLTQSIGQNLKQFSRHVGGTFFRQLVHYFFHTLLSRIARVLLYTEGKVESLLRSNRLLAKRAQQERTTRNMLDEIAEHRAATAFTDEERQQHKDDALRG